MKKTVLGTIIATLLIFVSVPIYGSEIQIKVDNVLITADRDFEIKNNKMMI